MIGGEFVAELIGTMILIILGDGVVANVILEKNKSQNSGWIVITTGWGLAVAMAVYAAGWTSGAHINPAVTIGLAAAGRFEWAKVPTYIIAQFIGAFIGAIVVWLAFLKQFEATENKAIKLGVFCTAPEVRSVGANLVTEIIGTFVLLGGVVFIFNANNDIASGIGPLAVGFLVWSIGLSLGGPTGYAINPARDLGPRIAHAVLPIPDKGGSDWGYSWIPVVGPIIGGVLGAVLFGSILGM